MKGNSSPLSCSALIAGVVVTVIGGLILAWILGQGPFARTPIPTVATIVVEFPKPTTGPAESASELSAASEAEGMELNALEVTNTPELAPEPTVIPLPFVPLELPWNGYINDELSPEWLRIETPPMERAIVDVVGGNPNWSDYVLTLDGANPARGQYLGSVHVTKVMVRMQDLRNHVSFVLDCDEGSWWEITQDGESETVLGTINTSSEAICSVFHLELRVLGDSYEAYIDGALQSSFNDATFSEGFIGLFSHGKAFENAVEFDNLVVSPP